jgi:hypothetical protein
MKKLLIYLFLIKTFDLIAQNGLKRTAYAVEGVAYGKIENKKANWEDNVIGIVVYRKRQWKDSKGISIYPNLEMSVLVPQNKSKIGFKFLINGMVGLGATLFNEKRLSFPIMLNFGAAFSRVDSANKNLLGVLAGFKGGLNFFITHRFAITGSAQWYGFSGGDNITLNSVLIPDRFDYSSVFTSFGFLLSFQKINKK